MTGRERLHHDAQTLAAQYPHLLTPPHPATTPTMTARLNTAHILSRDGGQLRLNLDQTENR